MSDLTEIHFDLNTGAKIPAIGLGTWQSKPNDVSKAVEHALKSGYRHIDTALAYGNEHEVGAGIRASGIPREEIFLTTKLDNTWHARVEEGITTSLKNLGVDYIDLYLMHWPSSTDPSDTSKHLPDWDFVRTWAEMQKLPASGRVRAIGVSNFGIKNLTRLLEAPSTTIVPAVNQIELHPYNPSPKLVAFNTSKGIHSSGYSPLGSTNSPLHDDAIIKELAEKYKVSIAQIVLAWGVQSGWSVLPKSVSLDRIVANRDGLKGWRLDDADLKKINTEVKGRHKVCGDSWLPIKVFFGDDE